MYNMLNIVLNKFIKLIRLNILSNLIKQFHYIVLNKFIKLIRLNENVVFV